VPRSSYSASCRDRDEPDRELLVVNRPFHLDCGVAAADSLLRIVG